MDQAFFVHNRQHLLERIEDAEAILVLFSGIPRRRTADEDYPFYASRSFVYLTGLEKENLVYLAWRQGRQWQETLFLPPTDPIRERWMGRMLHPDQAECRSGIAENHSREEFDEVFRHLVGGMTCPTVWLDFDPPAENQPPEVAQVFADSIRRNYPWCRIANCHPTLRRMRSIKQPQELEDLRHSIDITGKGIRAMLRACCPGLYEYHLRAVFEKTLADEGVREPAFETIVGAGKNSLVMHYPEQDTVLTDGDLVLIDLGAQYGYCGADISRVFPVSGHFSPRQKLLHEASLSTIDYLLERIKPGMPMSEIDHIGDENLREKLTAIGLLSRNQAVTDYRWHTISHHLGFDIHDDSDYTMPLTSGMVITMEVGVYVPQWGEGVRIEDDILITSEGCQNLSRQIPCTISEIESIMTE